MDAIYPSLRASVASHPHLGVPEPLDILIVMVFPYSQKGTKMGQSLAARRFAIVLIPPRDPRR